MHFEQSAILTVHNHVITRNPRISVTHDKHDKHRTWYLHITNVQEEDKGRYMCQINTVTAKTQFGYLSVVGKFPNNKLRLIRITHTRKKIIRFLLNFIGHLAGIFDGGRRASGNISNNILCVSASAVFALFPPVLCRHEKQWTVNLHKVR